MTERNDTPTFDAAAFLKALTGMPGVYRMLDAERAMPVVDDRMISTQRRKDAEAAKKIEKDFAILASSRLCVGFFLVCDRSTRAWSTSCPWSIYHQYCGSGFFVGAASAAKGNGTSFAADTQRAH